MPGYSAGFAEWMSRRMQLVRQRKAVYPVLANFEERPVLKEGDTVHRPFKTLPRVQSYTRGSDYSIATRGVTDESLVVNAARVAPFRADELDELQSSFKLRQEFADDLVKRLDKFAIEGDWLGEYDQADHKVDDVEINGGTAGDGFELTTANVIKAISQAKKKLIRDGGADPDKLAAVISSDFHSVLWERLESKESEYGDKVSQNGFVGRYNGIDFHLADSVGWSARLTLGANPSNNDTFTVNSTVITFKTTLTAGGTDEVLIGSTAAATADNIVGLFNGTLTAGTEYNNFADSNVQETTSRGKTLFITATDGTTYVDFKAEGRGYVAVSSSFTSALNGWTIGTTAKLQIQHNLFMEKGSIDLVIQARPKIRIVPDPDQVGDVVTPWTLYGLKTFDEGDAGLCDVRIRTDGFAGTKSTNVI